MFKLFSFEYGGSTFEIFGSSWSGLERLVVDGEEIASKRNFSPSSSYEFVSGKLGRLALSFRILMVEGKVSYELKRDGVSVLANSVPMGMPGWAPAQRNPQTAAGASDGASQAGTAAHQPPKGSHTVAWLGLATKIFQSGKALKVALAGVAVSGWTVLYSLPFALALTATLVFHEYGHLRAMKRFGIRTKGMYLIPFVGGIAVGENARTHWQDVYIAMMGPVFGLFMTAAFYLGYLITSNHLAGLVASVSALVNVFNLLPIHPLDGGRVVRALVFSGRNRLAFAALIVGSAACFALSVTLGLALLSFFIVIGAVDLMFGWRQIEADEKARLDRYGILFSLGWYLLTVTLFIGIIVLIARDRLPGSEIAVRILQS